MSLREKSLRGMSVTGIVAMIMIGAIHRSMAATAGSLAAGTVIPVTLNNQLRSNQSVAGDTFTANVNSSKITNTALQGGVVTGIVKAATPRNGKNPGTINVAFTSIRLANGHNYSISGVPYSLDPKLVTQGANGVLVAKNGVKNERLTYAGIGAGAGSLVSILGNGKFKVVDVLEKGLIGGALGYLAGSILRGPTQVKDVDLKVGTQMGVLLNQNFRYARTSYTSTASTSYYGGVSNASGRKYYTYNGQRYYEVLATGQRVRMNASSNRKYYTYNGHHYYKDLTTGNRVQLD